MKKITADKKDKIRILVDVLYNFLPLSSHNKKAITFFSIFKESDVVKYLTGDNKKQQLIKAWEMIIKKHPRLPNILLRKIVPAAINYRKYKRDPLKKSELDRLIIILQELKIGVATELKKIKLDESRPLIKVPPLELYTRLQHHSLVPEIDGEPLELFRNGHYNEAVRKASELFEVRVQTMSKSSLIGKDLMSKVFNLNNPLIKLNKLGSENEKGIQEGYHFLTMGLMRGIRNIFSHGAENQREPEESFEMLIFINWLFRQLK